MSSPRSSASNITSALIFAGIILHFLGNTEAAFGQMARESHVRLVINGTNYKGCDGRVSRAVDLLVSDISKHDIVVFGKPSVIISSGQFNYVAVVDLNTDADVNALLEHVRNGKGVNLLRSISDVTPDVQIHKNNKIEVVSLKQTALSKPDSIKLPVAVWSAVYPIAIGTSAVIRQILPSAPPYVNMAIMTGILVPTMINLISPNILSSLGGWIYPGGDECSPPK